MFFRESDFTGPSEQFHRMVIHANCEQFLNIKNLIDHVEHFCKEYKVSKEEVAIVYDDCGLALVCKKSI